MLGPTSYHPSSSVSFAGDGRSQAFPFQQVLVVTRLSYSAFEVSSLLLGPPTNP